MELGSPEKLPSPFPISSVSRRDLVMYLSVRKQLRKMAKKFIEREMKNQPVAVGWGIESLGDEIEGAAKNISATFLQEMDVAPSLSESEEDEIQGGLDRELYLFCEQICEEMKKLLNVLPTTTTTTTEEEKQQQIQVLQSISDTISEFCAIRWDEFEQATMELEAAKDSLDLQSVEEQEGEGKQGKTEDKSAVGGDQTETETETEEEEAPWVDIYHQGKSVTQLREEELAAYRRCWEREWGKGHSFQDLSLLSPMMFTHCTPSIGALVGRTLQIYSVKIAEIKGLRWPLKVYGVVAARDEVDKQRNPLFLRSRDNYQIVHQKHPFLQLTGPSRAIVSEEPVEIEVQLRLNRGNKSDDRPLISDVVYYNSDRAHLLGSSGEIENHFCKIELSYQQLEQSVQATFLGFHVGEPSPSFKYGVRIVCSSLSQRDNIEDVIERQVVLFDSRCGKMPLELSRQVVSVELQGKLQVLIEGYAQPSGGGVAAAHGSVFITPQKCNTSLHACDIGGSEVKFTVAWSLLLADKSLMSMNGYVDPFVDLPSFDPSLMEKLGISE